MKKYNAATAPGWFFPLFIVVGLAVTFFSFITPCANVLLAQKWDQRSCIILKSGVKTTIHHDPDGDSSSTKIDIQYEYICRGQEFNSTRYSFFDKINRTRNGAQNIAAKFPIGSTAMCYVNPDKPTEAVLERNIEAWDLLGLVPLVFTAAGAAGLWQRRKGKKAVVPNESHGEVELKHASRMKTAIGFWVVGLIFCASAVFLWKQMPSGVSLSSLHHIFDSMVALQLVFMSVVFGGVGLLLLFISVISFLAAYNPVVRIKLVPSRVELGKAAAVTWDVQGRIERLRKFRVLLECRKKEQIENRENSRINTKTTKLYSDELLATTDLKEIAKGQIGFVIGPEQKATSRAVEEGIRWYVVVKGEIKRWPDISDEFEFEVLNQ